MPARSSLSAGRRSIATPLASTPVYRTHIEDDAFDFLAFMPPDQIEESLLDVFGLKKMDGAIDPDPLDGDHRNRVTACPATAFGHYQRYQCDSPD